MIRTIMTKISAEQLQTCLDIINQSLYASSAHDVEVIWQQICKLCNVEGLALSVAETSDREHIKVPSALVFGFPEGWFESYFQNNYVLVDPVIKMGFHVEGVFAWNEAFAKYGQSADSQAFLHHAMSAGLAKGYAVATKKHNLSNTASVCSVSVSGDITEIETQLLYRILPHLNEIMARPGFLHGPSLTKRESQIIALAENKASNAEIAQQIGVTQRTVKFHFNNIYKKLNVNNKLEAVYKAKVLGMLK